MTEESGAISSDDKVTGGWSPWQPWPAQIGKTRPLGMLWTVWALLAAAAYWRPVWTSTRLLFHPVQPAGRTVSDHLRAQATVSGSTLQVCIAVVAVVLIGYSQLERRGIGIRATARTPLVIGRGTGAALAYLFVLAAAAAMTAQALSSLHLAVRGYPGAADAAHSAELTRAFLFGSVAAGIGEEILLFAIPIALARKAGWSTPATIALVTALRLAIHTYYGWGSLFVLLWIPAGYALYRAAGSIWPLIVGHTVYDAIQFSIDSWPPAGDVLVAVNLTFAMAGAVVGFLGYNRYWRGWQDGRRSQPAAAA